jgi:hypothetical protein
MDETDQSVSEKREKSMEPEQMEKKIKLSNPIEERPSTRIVHRPAQPEQPVNQFLNFKFPEETKGQVLNDLNELAEIEKISKEPCDRKPILFNLDQRQSSETGNSEEIGDEFFDVTVQDLRYMLNDLKQKQNEDQPLMTKQMRELEQDKKAMKYAK